MHEFRKKDGTNLLILMMIFAIIDQTSRRKDLIIVIMLPLSGHYEQNWMTTRRAHTAQQNAARRIRKATL